MRRAVNEAATIEVTGVGKAYEEGRIRALDGMNLNVGAGEYVALVGPSGCGKSTLLHLIAALDRPDEGSIVVAGHDLAHERDLSHYRARHVGMVFQLHNLLPTLTAVENVQMPMFELGIRSSERERRARHLLALVGMEERERNQPTQLSGGERQRVAIARALANEPGVILADEPTGSLDSTSGLQVMELLESVCRERGATLVLVTHAPDLALRADRIVRMLDGRELPDAGAPPVGAEVAGAAADADEELRDRVVRTGV
jgi:putative ABC transport system ATP-binding protein